MQDRTVKTELDKLLGASSGAPAANQMMTVVLGTSPGTGSSVSSAASNPAAPQGALADAIAQTVSQIEQVRSSIDSQLNSITENTRALADNTASKSVAGAASNMASSLLSNVLGGGILGPILSGLTQLFGGDGQSTSTAAAKFALPPAVQFSAGLQNGMLTGADHGADGLPRATGSANQASAPPITVNVTAMDSRSFLDHSNDIATAVRNAMLESNSLNDVIGEL